MKTLYKNFTLIDGTGKAPVANMSMLVEDGRILALGQETEADEVVDLSGKYVMPGMIEAHTHLTGPYLTSPLQRIDDFTFTEQTIFAIKNLELYLQQGVTYIRDVGSFNKEAVELTLRKYLKSGLLKGPGCLCSGNIVTMTGGHAHNMSTKVADGVEEVRKATRKLIQEGVDLIKTVATGGVATEGNDINAYQYNLEELQAIVHEAKKANRKVAVHAHGTQGIKNAILAGIDSIEHGTLLDDEAIDMMVERGTYLVPTFLIQQVVLTDNRVPAYMKEKELEIMERHHESFRKAYKAGVKIAAGTDMTPLLCSSPIAKEIRLMVENSDMTILEGITAATGTGAKVLGIEATHGTLECGKVADFLVLDEDPLQNVLILETPSAVYQAGKKVN